MSENKETYNKQAFNAYLRENQRGFNIRKKLFGPQKLLSFEKLDLNDQYSKHLEKQKKLYQIHLEQIVEEQ